MEQYHTNTYRYGNATVVVHRPVLDEKERRRRETAIKTALAAFGKAAIRAGQEIKEG